jgi:hypothetical protein
MSLVLPANEEIDKYEDCEKYFSNSRNITSKHLIIYAFNGSGNNLQITPQKKAHGILMWYTFTHTYIIFY